MLLRVKPHDSCFLGKLYHMSLSQNVVPPSAKDDQLSMSTCHLVSAPLFSVFHQHVSMNWLKGNMSRNPGYMIGETNQILSRAFDAHFAQARRTPPVCGHWAVLTQRQKDPAKHLQNICQAALILAPCHTVWAIMSSHMWTYCKTHGIKTCSQLEDLKISKEFHHASFLARDLLFSGLGYVDAEEPCKDH